MHRDLTRTDIQLGAELAATVLGRCEASRIEAQLAEARVHVFSVETESVVSTASEVVNDFDLTVVHEYDTADRDLELLGMTVSRIPVEAGVVWRLRLPRGEELEAWEPGNEGLAPPAEIAELIASVVTDKKLLPAPPVGSDPGVIRLRETMGAQREALLLHDPGVRLGSDAENLHEHRIAARRSRAFLRATRAYVDRAWRRSIEEPLTMLAAATGPLRDLDVLFEHVRGEVAMLEGPDRTGGEALLVRLDAERVHARERVVDVLDGHHYRALVARLRLPPRLAEEVDAVPLERIARKEFRRLTRAVDRLGKHPSNSALHKLRITLKRARYSVELSPAGVGGGRKRFLASAKALQDLLGEHQDAVIAEQRLREATVSDAATGAAFVAGRIAERQNVRRAKVASHLPAAWKRLRADGKRL